MDFGQRICLKKVAVQFKSRILNSNLLLFEFGLVGKLSTRLEVEIPQKKDKSSFFSSKNIRVYIKYRLLFLK